MGGAELCLGQATFQSFGEGFVGIAAMPWSSGLIVDTGYHPRRHRRHAKDRGEIPLDRQPLHHSRLASRQSNLHPAHGRNIWTGVTDHRRPIRRRRIRRAPRGSYVVSTPGRRAVVLERGVLQKAPPLDGLGFTPADRSRSRYMTRGWTFQEILLSRRLLIFTPEVVFWECQSATWREDANWEILDPVDRGLTLFRNSVFGFEHEGIHVPKADPESFNRMYQSLVSDYGRRELTYDEDGLAAIGGILASIELTSGIGFTWGLPKPYLGVAITWPADNNASRVRRRKATYTIVADNNTIYVPYPSWSWVGWVGPNLFDDLFGHLAGEHAGLVFYMLDGEKDRLIFIEQNQEFIKMESTNRTHRRAPPTWREDVLREVSMKHVPQSLLVPELRPAVLIFWTSCCTLVLDHTMTRSVVRQEERKLHRANEGEDEKEEDSDDEQSRRVQMLRDRRGNKVRVVWDHYLNDMTAASGEAELIIVGRSSTEYARPRSELVAYMVEKHPSGARTRVVSATVAEEEWNALADRRWELVFLL
ncbi:hypothetical protein CGCSCA4_v004937 [Colletotrichum siamense]|uniref:Heterokaryon incompatibility domain-containing protein n=1 Tax=Colletotrichum siamense TaxID=690259 RepID=A0A9P5KB34_COLSI|nr:hypothetical protein CGCSCA4_v004937 [Colletotrichum siamense]KAF4866818.1 hypothetical protein CGCSCA2_v000136 [Colletotrichum siamense]